MQPGCNPVSMCPGTPLEEFEHPERAVYLLGSEDTGAPCIYIYIYI